MLCHVCGESFGGAQIYDHMLYHGINGYGRGHGLQNEIHQNFLDAVQVVVTYRECQSMLIERMCQSFHALTMQLVINDVPFGMLPRLETRRFGTSAVIELVNDNVGMRDHVIEMTNGVIERLGFANRRPPPN